MGRLDDIVKRNQQVGAPEELVIKAIGKVVVGDDKSPAEPAPSYTLPSQRKRSTAVWKILVIMVLAGAVFGYIACRQAERDMQLDRERFEQRR
jgi:hypothetical protein